MGVTESECTLQRKQAQSYDAILKFGELSIDRLGVHSGMKYRYYATNVGNAQNCAQFAAVLCGRYVKYMVKQRLRY
jgi:hypothetical protein